MAFADTLRDARRSRVAVLQEFWSQYNPHQDRLHMFFEGHEDGIYFRHFIKRYLGDNTRVYEYRCEGKKKVFDAFQAIVAKRPNIDSTLFFVDKDIDDIVGVPWPTDPRIFVTDVYSIENYLCTTSIVQAFYRNAVKLNHVMFDEETIWCHFDEQLSRFRRIALTIMAWIIAQRRAGLQPNLNNINLSMVCTIDDEGRIAAVRAARVHYLEQVTGVQARPGMFRQVAAIARDLSRMSAERIIRGKFESWFVVEFWRHVSAQLREVADECGGTATINPTLERSTVVAHLTPYADIPRSLELFFEAHLSKVGSGEERDSIKSASLVARLKKIISSLRNA